MNKSLRVLIVEDSMPDAELLLYELRQSGYEPTYEVVDTSEAMDEALEKQGWDIVLADYVMPSFGGLAALDLLKARGIDVPFIVVSGAIGQDIAVAAMKAGASDYVMKDNLVRLGPAIERELRDAEVRLERRRAEEERDRLMEQLRQVNEQVVINSLRTQDQVTELQAVIAALAEAIVVYGPSAEILRMNPAAAELLGYSQEEQEKPVAERAARLRPETEEGKPFPLEDSPAVRALRGETVRGVVMVLHRPSDGRPIRVSCSAAPILTPEGKPRAAVVIFTDVTALGDPRRASRPKG